MKVEERGGGGERGEVGKRRIKVAKVQESDRNILRINIVKEQLN